MAPSRPEDQTIVIFGASGDLTQRKLIPALWALEQDRLLPKKFRVIGYSRTPYSEDAFRSKMRSALSRLPNFSASKWDRFAPKLNYVAGEFAEPRAMAHLEQELNDRGVPRKKLFYCSTPPSAYGQIVRRIGEEGLEIGSTIVIEKPFGRDLATAFELNKLVHEVFSEKQVFRIDHYLGKETVQNILVFRFSNGIFEPIWNRRYVNRVEITVGEAGGIGHRGAFYEEAGAVRDIVQNHIFQVLTFLAMEPPASFSPESLRDEKAKVLAALRPVHREDVVRGQYVAGAGHKGYTSEVGVAARSKTETYVAMKLAIENWRWATVPFFIRTGKRLPRRVTEVTMQFNDAPHLLFHEGHPAANHLTLRIQPDEGISLCIDAKKPGPAMDIAPVTMDFSYAEQFGVESPEAYERLLRDAMIGDHTLFPRSDEVEGAWRAIQPILDDPPKLHPYSAGSWGPKSATELSGGWHLN